MVAVHPGQSDLTEWVTEFRKDCRSAGTVRATYFGTLRGLYCFLIYSIAPFRITVNCVSPAVYTRMTDRLMEVDQSTLEQRATRVPLGWFGQPEDAAPAFVFFAYKDADYITGQVPAVDGDSTL